MSNETRMGTKRVGSGKAKRPKPGARTWRFVLAAMVNAEKAPDGRAKVPYTAASNFDRTRPLDVANMMAANGWVGIVSNETYSPVVQITEVGRAALPQIRQWSEW